MTGEFRQGKVKYPSRQIILTAGLQCLDGFHSRRLFGEQGADGFLVGLFDPDAEAAVGADVAGHRDEFVIYIGCSKKFLRGESVLDRLEEHHAETRG